MEVLTIVQQEGEQVQNKITRLLTFLENILIQIGKSEIFPDCVESYQQFGVTIFQPYFDCPGDCKNICTRRMEEFMRDDGLYGTLVTESSTKTDNDSILYMGKETDVLPVQAHFWKKENIIFISAQKCIVKELFR